MNIKLDRVDGMHVIEGWEQHRFSSREDAETALEFARAFDALEMQREWRHRRAAVVGGSLWLEHKAQMGMEVRS